MHLIAIQVLGFGVIAIHSFMKKLLVIVALCLLWCNVSVAGSLNANKYQNEYHAAFKQCINEISSYGNFNQNPKMYLDIEECIRDEDEKILLNNLSNTKHIVTLLEICFERHKRMFALAKEISIDMIQGGNKTTHLKRYLNKRMQIWKQTLSRQELLAGL